MTPRKFAAGLTGLVLVLVSTWSLAQQCELDRPVMFAGLDWDSNRINTAIARYIIEEGYGCRTDRIPGSTIPLLTGLRRGDLDVMMEVWKNNIPEVWSKALAEGSVVEVGINFPDAVQGWYVPRFVIEGDPERGIEPMAPELKSVFDMSRYTELFRDPEEPGKGRFYNCILGWQCEIINTRKLRAYGLDDDYTNFRPGTGDALTAVIASAYKRGQPIFAYYWAPTWVMGFFDLVRLEEPPYDKEVWKQLQAEENPQEACAYPKAEVVVGANKAFYHQAPQLIEFLEKYQTSNALISKLLAYMQENRADVQETALHFLSTRSQVWTQWVPDEVAERVMATLK